VLRLHDGGIAAEVRSKAGSDEFILTVMRRQVVALALLLVIAGAPDALAVCHLVCASSAALSDTASHTHHDAGRHPSSGVESGFSRTRPAAPAWTTSQAAHESCQRDEISPVIVPPPERAIAAVAVAVIAVLPPSSSLDAAAHADVIHAVRSTPVSLHQSLRI
jgi:hypothetical protein